MRKRYRVANLAVLLVLVASNVVGALVTGVTATASSTYSTRAASNTVNYSGLSVPVDAFANTGVTHSASYAHMWLSTGSGFGGIDTNPSITFNLGAVYTISRLHVWNYNEGAGSSRGVKDLSIMSSVADGIPLVTRGAYTFAQAPESAAYTGQVVAISTQFQAKIIKFAIVTNYGDPNVFYGLSEVQFDGAVVDPSTLPGLITGVTATASSTYSTRAASNTVNYSGLSVPVDAFANTGVTHSASYGHMWLSTGSGFGGIDPDPWITFDLGDQYMVYQMRVWNYNEGGLSSRGVKDLDLYTSKSGVPYVLQGPYTFAQAPGAVGYAGEFFTFATPFATRFIKFAIVTNYADPNVFYGLSEVQFNGLLLSPRGTIIKIH